VYFRITADSVELVEPEDVRAFSVVCPPELTAAQLAAGIERAELGELLPDGEHVMVAVDAVRRLADGRVGPGWPDDLAKMIDYAAGKGWTDADRTRVRAHIERR
jgi:hypothetical protein